MNVTDLRKAFTAQGIKGFSSANRAAFNAAIAAAEVEAHAEDAAHKPVAKAAKRGICTECGRKEGFRGSELCDQCREYAEWENAHSDNGHDGILQAVTDGEALPVWAQDEQPNMVACPVCHPELDPRNVAPKSRSRAGMVIVAKGSEIHKSLTFKEAAEKLGWTVEISRETYELDDDAEGEGTRHFATATKGDESISLAWDGRAYDYHASSAVLKGKGRKVRNLKEALRLI